MNISQSHSESTTQPSWLEWLKSYLTPKALVYSALVAGCGCDLYTLFAYFNG